MRISRFIRHRTVRHREHNSCPADPGAYLTVEASMVLPLVLLLIFGLVMLSLYVYGRAGLEADSYLLLFRESVKKNGTEARANICSAYPAQAAGRFPALQTPSFTVSEQGRQLILEADTDSAGRSIRIRETAYRYDPPGDIRTYRRLLFIARSVKEKLGGDGRESGDSQAGGG